MILFAHPTGNNNVRHAATAMLNAGILAEMHICIAACGSNLFSQLVQVPGMTEIHRRTYDSTFRGIIKLHPTREAIRLISTRFGWRQLIKHETGVFSTDAVYRSFDLAVARRVKLVCETTNALGLTGVYAYEDGALETFRCARAAGLSCFYDLPIAFWRTSRRLLQEEAQRLPEWEQTLIGTQDSAAKCARKDAELDLADAIFCPSNFVRDSIPAELRNQKQVFVVPFGSPDDLGCRISRSDWQLDDPSGRKGRRDRLRVLFAGSMTQRKGLADLFAAMKLLGTEQIELHVMGSPIVPIDFYRGQYPHFVYHATRSNADVLKLMQTMDVFCLPSIVEGRALVIQEAMSQGLPIIITPNTGGEDLVDVTHPFHDSIYGRGATGFLVPIRSPERIAECIAWCSDHRQEVVAMGHAAIRKSQEYTWKAYGDGIVKAVRDAVRER